MLVQPKSTYECLPWATANNNTYWHEILSPLVRQSISSATFSATRGDTRTGTAQEVKHTFVFMLKQPSSSAATDRRPVFPFAKISYRDLWTVLPAASLAKVSCAVPFQRPFYGFQHSTFPCAAAIHVAVEVTDCSP